mmetsp:Transcript_36113/g.84639  ORF Transcript_36113/g.84639 Transcript_36113/m.84639 type:complete len:526 (+) Transcript_36113:124-1701(+)|eukprot:CAMPEP_0178421944 /NCGR_PEP_ID=MMETSP0689_2-20121128/26913_1 /TAXON_ID=160604 /ORGANISM="Amphidinium massartii, Strain CS-259" /LENGTH=525 /DNA_ID=CAMNT_0020043481 /DNA_START=36 /DNA_END=1613 /DNA_ORIENTATION=-
MAELLQGTVKSFSLRDPETKKGGYGFIMCPKVVGDVWFGNKDLPEDLLEACENRLLTLKEREVVFEAQPNPKDPSKPQAASVKLFPALNEKMCGKVRSYNQMKGFGFITSSSLDGQDVYFSKKDLPPAQQMMSMQSGTTVAFTLTQLEDGKLQGRDVQVALTAAVLQMLQGGGAGPMGGMMQMGNFGGQGGGNGMMHQQMGGPPSGMMGMGGGNGMMGMGGGNGMMGMGMGMGGGNGMMMNQNQMQRASPAMKSSTGEKSGLQGVIAKFMSDKGFGFINSPSHPGDIYFKGNGAVYEIGTQVTFTLTLTSDGKAQAKNLSAALFDGQTLEGTVKSYVPSTGYGFINVPDRCDVYFKGALIPAHQQDDDYVGRPCRFTVNVTQSGKPQVAEFLHVGESRGMKRSASDAGMGMGMGMPQQNMGMGMPPQNMGMMGAQFGGAGQPAPKRTRTTTLNGGPMLMGNVKSFNPQKGFGFITCPATGGDFFFLRTSLPAEYQQNDALAGVPVQFYAATASDGRQQAENLQFG